MKLLQRTSGLAALLVLFSAGCAPRFESEYVRRMQRHDAGWHLDRVDYEAELQQFRRWSHDDNAAHQHR